MKRILNKLIRSRTVKQNAKRLTDLVNDPALTALRTLPERLKGARVFLVGGSVRDFLLGGHAKDFDLCVTGSTAHDVETFLKSFPDAKVVFAGSTFPVFKFRAHADAPELDIALARTEHSTGGGSLQDFSTFYDPSVKIEEDLSRRDFTWNAFAVDLADGSVIDPFHGIDDLKAGVVRTVGNALDRFTEDRTRALRGLRFAAKLGFAIDPDTWEAIRTFAPRMNETTADGEFILKRELAGREFLKSLDADPMRTCDLYDRSGMFDTLIPEITRCKFVLQRPDFHPEGDVFTHTVLALKSLHKDASLATKLAVFFHDLGKVTKFQVFDRESKKEIPLTVPPEVFCKTDYDPEKHLIKNIDHERDSAEMSAAIISRFAMTASGIDADLVTTLVREHMFHGLLAWKLSKIEKTLFAKNGQPIWEMYEMAVADACGSHGNMDYARTVKHYIEELLSLREEKAKEPPRLIDGNDVMQEMHIKPGPEIKALLEKVRERQLEALVAKQPFTREDAIRALREP